jgi:hypothetical protein
MYGRAAYAAGKLECTDCGGHGSNEADAADWGGSDPGVHCSEPDPCDHCDGSGCEPCAKCTGDALTEVDGVALCLSCAGRECDTEACDDIAGHWTGEPPNRRAECGRCGLKRIKAALDAQAKARAEAEVSSG